MVPRHTPGISWWAAYTTHMLRVSLVYILIYGSILAHMLRVSLVYILIYGSILEIHEY